MANFLNRMAARALGSATAAQPVVPSLFTPGFGLAHNVAPRDTGPAGHDHEAEVTAVAAPATPAAHQPARDATLPREWESPDSGIAGDTSVVSPGSLFGEEKALPAIHPRGLSPATAMTATEPAPLPAPGTAIPDFQPDLVEARLLDRVLASTNTTDGNGTEADAGAMVGPVIAPQVMPARRSNPQTVGFGPALPGRDRSGVSRRDQSGSAAPEPPVIRVTIGRIDVRAQFPAPAPSPVPARRTRPAALTLDDYLKQRSEGKR